MTNSEQLYNSLLNKGYTEKNIGDRDTFLTKMQDKENRRKLYDFINKRGDFRIGNYDSYEQRLASDYLIPQPMQENIALSMAHPMDKADPALRTQSAKPIGDIQASQNIGHRAEMTFNTPEQRSATQVISENAEKINSPSLIDPKVSKDPIQQAISQDLIGQAASKEWQRDTEQHYKSEKERLQALYNKEIAKTSGRQFSSSFMDYNPSADTAISRNASLYSQALQYINDAEHHMDNVRNDAGLAQGVSDAIFDIDTLTLGLDSLFKNNTLKAILDKADADQPLTQAEESLLNAALYKQFTEAAYSNGKWYNVGKGFGEQVPYMLEFALSGGVAGALTKGAGKAIGKQVVKYINNLALKNGRKIANRTARNVFTRGSRMLGNTLSQLPGGVMRAVVQVPLRTSVYNDVVERQIGTLGYNPSEDGLTYTGRIDADNTADAITKGLTSGFITNLTESIGGEGIQFITNKIGGLMGKGANALFKNLQSPRFYNRFREAVSKRGLKPMLDAVGFNGAPAEFAEEILDQTLNAIFVGDSSLDPNSENYVFDLDNLIDTAITTGAISLFMGGMGAALSAKVHHDVNKAFAQANHNLEELKYSNLEIQALNDIAIDNPQNTAKWVSSITRTMRTLATSLDEITNSLSPEARQYIDKGNSTKEEFNELSPYDQQAVTAFFQIRDRFNELTIQRDYVVAGTNYNAMIQGLKERVAPQAEAELADIQANALRDSDYTVKVTFRGQDGYLVSGTADIDNLPDGSTEATLPAGNIYQVRTKSPDGQWLIQQAVAEDITPGTVTPTQQLIDETTARIYMPVQSLLNAEQAQAQAEVAQSQPTTEQPSPIVEQASPIVEQASPIVEQPTGPTDVKDTTDSKDFTAPNGSSQSTDAQPLSDEQFDEHIATLPTRDAIQAITQRRGANEADQYAQWRKGILTKERDKAQKALNAKVKPFDASRYPDYAQMKREERKYNEALQATRFEALGIINRTTAEIADIDRYLADRNRQIAAEREAENPLRNGIAQAVEKQPINTIEQYIARYIALGGRLRMTDLYTNGLAAELGITPGSQEHRELLSILSNTDGMTPEQLAQDMVENIEPEYRHLVAGRDTQDIRNAIIDTIQSGVTSRKKAYDFIADINQRADDEQQRYIDEQEQQAEIDADTEQAIREYEELLLSSITPDDLAIIDTMAGDYWDEILAIQQYEQEAYNDYDTNSTSTTPRITQRGAESTAIQSGSQPSNTTPIRQDSQDTATIRPATPQPSRNGSTIADNEREGEINKQVAQAEAEVNTNPTEAQKEAGNYKKGHIRIGVYDITIEQPQGSIRRGVDANGKAWESKMYNTYGYIRGTEGVDGDHIDVFLANDMDSWNREQVFVVDQYNEDGTFDEHKVMLGFNDINDAETAYLSNYEKDWAQKRHIVTSATTTDDFERWIDSSHRKTKAFAEYKSVKTTEGQNASADKDLRRKLADFNIGDVVRDYYNQKLYRIKKHSTNGVSTIAELDAEGNEVGTTTMNAHNNSRYSLVEAPVKAETPTISQDSEQVSDQDNAPYTIAPAQYTTKKGKVLDMQLVKFAGTLTKEQQRAAKELAKADKGWYDREQGGFMMRSQESAQQLADTIASQPISMTDIKALNDGDIAFTEPQQSENKPHAPIWQYSIHVDTDGYTVLTREDVSSGIAVGDAHFSPAADSPEEMLEILRNPHNNMQEVLDAVGVILENKIKTRELDRKIAKQRKQEYEALRANGVNGYKIDEIVIYKGKEAHIHDFEEFGNHRPVLDTGMAPVIYEVAEWSDIEHLDKDKSPAGLNAPEATNSQEQPANQGQFGLVSDDRMAELKERLRRKLGGQMNIGIDPEILSIGLEIAVGHIDRGIKSFTDFARVMINDLGDTIRPYLKAFYNGARDLPEVIDNGLATDMTPYDEVQQFDITNFDRTVPDLIATATNIVREAEVANEVNVAKQRIKRSTEKKKSLPSSSNQLNLFDNTDNNNEDAREQDTRTNNRRTQPRREELSETESVEPRTPLQHSVEIGRSKRGNTRTSSNQLGNRPLYDVNKNYSNEEISQIVSSVTDIVDGRVVITAPITDDIRAICHQYKSGGVAKKGHGILDEYYTDGKIVDAVSMLITPYFNNSNAIRVLEPSVGVGNFISAVDNIPTSEIVTFEINPTTARIAKILYPGIEVNLRSFETEFIDDAGNKKPLPQKYNLIIGNPPYGSHRGLYKGLGEESKIARYEDYFVKRSLDVLNEGGVLAMVLPSSWIDRHTRYGGYTIEAAYRLPSGAFEATQVGTDIVVLRKDSSIPAADHTPYFEQHPERILGEVKQRKGRYGKMEDYVQGDIDTAIEAIKRDHAEQLAQRLDIAPSNDNLNNIEEAIDETGSPEKATAIVQTAKAETNNPAPANNTTKKSKYKTELNRGVETVPTSLQFSHQFSEGEVEAFYDTEYDGTIKHPSQHHKYANYIGGRAMHDFYYAEGDIYAKLDQLESEKENIIATYGQEQYDKQKRLLMSVLPKRKGLSEITISPNTTFVKNLYIDTDKGSITLRDAFIDFCSKLPYQAFGDSSSWEVRGYVNNEQVYGQDKERNALVRERRKRVANDLFVKFLNEELSQSSQNQVVVAFNREYNSTYRPDYSRVPMFSTINKDFRGKPLKLTSVQLAGIGRMTVKGVGVLAHEVGFGKTLSGILAMHEAMTRGFATKPLVVVPNDNILKQWVETIKEVLPQATVNTLGNLGTSYDLTDFKVNDGEFTLVTYEGLKAMSFSDSTYNRLAERFSYITEDLKKHQSERDMQKEIEKKLELKGKMKRGAKTSYGFEDFGFDWLTVDEVHNCNHIISKVRLDKSVSSDFRSQNQRTSDLGLKTWLAAQYIQEENNGRNVLLLSATPFTNKPLEYYSILSLVGNKMLKRKGFFHVDQFFSTFMEADNELEIGANGRPTQKTNVRRFRNNGLFQQLLSEFIDIKGEEDNPELVRPDRHNKEYKINPNELTEDAMAAVQDLLNDNDTVLQGIGHARAAAFSPYATSLLGIRPKNHREFVKNSPKINTTIKLIEQNKKDRPDAGQIIYSEVGVEFFPMIRDYLVNESGFKPSEVRIITGATSNAERVNIQSAFNKGDVKVVIGSPAIKEGLNLQENTTDMYILSLPWNFTQLRQIEGRGWRQGNKWENIRINYMLTNNSVDVFMLQRLQLKQGLYNEAMKKGAETLDVSDIDTSELKTALITDPAVRAEIVTKQEREKLEQQRTQIEADLSFVLRKYESYNKLIEKLESKKKEINQFKEWAAGGNTYWADRVQNEENKLNAIVADIQEEKERLQKKGVNVDDIVLQTEQSQKAIEDINQKIENLKEYQEELTDKYRREQELKQQQQGDLLSTYIKERKAENNSGFYKIRPKDSQIRFRSIRPDEYAEMDANVDTAENLSNTDEDDDTLYRSDDTMYRIREDAAPKNTGIGYKVFVLKNGELYPPMVANPNGEATPVGVWLDADAAPVAGQSKTGRSQVKAGGKGTQGGSGKLAYRPGWHLGEIPYALQFNRNDENGERTLFPANFVWAEVEYANDVDYQEEAMSYGYNQNGKFQHSYAGLPRVPENGAYTYRTNPNPETDPWIITGAMRVKRLLTPTEVDEMVKAAGREPQRRQEGAITDEQIIALNTEIANDYREGVGSYTDDELAFENDPISKVLGKPRYTRKQRREFAERERKRMVARVESLAKKLNLDNVEIVTDANSLKGKKQRAKGFYTKSTGKITIVIPNHSSTFDVEQTLLHEAVAHYGLRQLFGEHFDTFLDNVFNNADKAIRQRIVALTEKNAWDVRKATEEYLAMLAENTEFENTNASWWNKIKTLFLNMLHKIGFDNFSGVTLTDNELRYILWRSYENLAEPGKYRSILGDAKDVVMQNNLKVGNFQIPLTNNTFVADDILFRSINPGESLSDYARAVVANSQQTPPPTGLNDPVGSRSQEDLELIDAATDRFKEYFNAPEIIQVFSRAELRKLYRDMTDAEFNERFKEYEKIGAIYDADRDKIYTFVENSENTYVELIHEATHAAIQKLYNSENLKDKLSHFVNEIEKLAPDFCSKLAKAYSGDDYINELTAYTIDEFLEKKSLDDLLSQLSTQAQQELLPILKTIGYEKGRKQQSKQYARIFDTTRKIRPRDGVINDSQTRKKDVHSPTDVRDDARKPQEREVGVGRDAIILRPQDNLAADSAIDSIEQASAEYTDTLNAERQAIIDAITPAPDDSPSTVARKIMFRSIGGELVTRDNTELEDFLAIANKISNAMTENDARHKHTAIAESQYDSMQRLHNLIDDLRKQGALIDERFDPWLTQNQSRSRAQAETKVFDLTYRQPLYEAIARGIRALFPGINTKDKAENAKGYSHLSLYAQARTAVERQAVKSAQARAEAEEKGEEYKERDFGGLAGIQEAIFGLYSAIDDKVEAVKGNIEKLTALATERGIPTVQEYIDNAEAKLGNPDTNGTAAHQLWTAIRSISAYQLTYSYNAGLTSRAGYQTLTYGRNIDALLREKYNMQVRQIKDNPGSYDNVTDYDKDGNATGKRMVLNDNARIALNKLNKEYADAIDAVPMPGKNGNWQQLIDTGWLTEEDVNSLHRYYMYYMPLKGHAELTAEDIVDYENKTPRNQSRIKTVEGHSHLAKDPFNQLILDTHGAIQNAEQNRWRTHLYNILTNNPNPSQYVVEQRFYKIETKSDGSKEYVPYGKVETINGAQVFIPGRPTAEELANGTAVSYNNRFTRAEVDIPIRNDQRTEHSVTVMVDGEAYTMFFYDKRIADAINGTNIKHPWKQLEKLQALNRLYAGLKTSLNPTFTLISNLPRDWMEMVSNNFIEHGFAHAVTSFIYRVRATRAGDVQAALRKYQDGKLLTMADATSDVERYVVEFFNNGGSVNITQLPDYNTAKVELMDDLNTYMRTGEMPKGSAWARGFNNMAERVELAPRLATYIASRTLGRNISQSINDAKEATVNFDRKGSWSGIMGILQLFYNASAQSVRRQIGLARRHPVRFAATYATIGLLSPFNSIMASYISSLLLGDDDDIEDICRKYFAINPELRRRYFIILIGDDYIRIPMAVNYLPYVTLGDVITNWRLNPNYRPNVLKDTLDIASAILDTFLPSMIAQPIGFMFDAITAKNDQERAQALIAAFGSAFNRIPILEPLGQSLANYNFMGGTLFDRPFDKNSQEPAYLRARQYTQPVWVWASHLLNDITGGNEVHAGWLNIAPEQIENVMTVFGGYGEYGENIISLGIGTVSILSGEKPDTEVFKKSFPLLSRLYGGNTQERYDKSMQSMFYDDATALAQYNEYRKNATTASTRADFDREYSPDEQRYFADLATMQTIAKRIRTEIKAATPEGEAPKYHEDERLKAIYNLANKQFHSLASGEYKPIDNPYYTYMYIKDAIEKAPHRTADGSYRLLDLSGYTHNKPKDEATHIDVSENVSLAGNKLMKNLVRDYQRTYSEARNLPNGYYPGMKLSKEEQQQYDRFAKQVTTLKKSFDNINFDNILTDNAQ